MKHLTSALLRVVVLVVVLVAALVSTPAAQQRGRGGGRVSVGVAPVPLPDGPVVFDTAEQHKIRVVVVTRELSHPWGMTWMPNGDLLVTERPGRLRIVRNGVLDPTPISGLPPIHVRGLAGLLDVALHPNFAANKLVYFSYVKDGDRGATTAVFRARLDGMRLTEVKDIFVSESWMKGNDFGDGRFGSRILFAKDGTLFVTCGDRDRPDGGQNPADHFGKVIRINDDGSVPKDNPFVGKAGYLPQIYTFGQRNQQGLVFNPVNGELWASEQGPNGGDEINVIKPGKNYGWPIVSYGRQYAGPNQSEIPYKAGMELPTVFWVPSIATSGMTFYTGDRFPSWKNNVFVGAMRTGEIDRTGHLERIVFNEKWEEIRRESFLTEMRQRIRDVRQGPDGLLYVLTDEDQGALLRIEPAE
ncbi:MAG TPA: PQQ-dependent sugar dehydrogenase [Vicinamibacterales bacterium]|nr:PQQ-dependent sugar dehydrogenase [Vicinamibacterales bacterium]